jgi:uncharacterized spore protein YtfJ
VSKQRIEKLRIPRDGTARHRSLAGGIVIGDYVDPTNGERVLTVEKVSVGAGKAKSKARAKVAEQFNKIAKESEASMNAQLTGVAHG